MKKHFFSWGLQQRLITSVMIVFFVPMLLLGVYILSTLNQKLYDNAVASAGTLLDTVEHGLTDPLESAQDTASLMAADNELYTFLSRPQQDAYIVNFFLKRLHPEMTQLSLQYPALRVYRLLHHNPSLFPIRNILRYVEDISAVTAQMRDEGSRLAIKSIQYSASGRAWREAEEKNVWYVDSIVPATAYAPAGVVEFVLSHDDLWAMATQAVPESGLHVLLISQGELISATHDEFAAQALGAPRAGVHSARGCTLVLREMKDLKMTLCCVIPSSLTSLPTPQLLVVLLALLAITALTYLLVRLICRRQLHSLNALTARIDAISPDGAPLSSQEPADEVERLSQHFDSMYQRLGESFHREKHLLYDDLTNQLKPHFICNAMDMLRLQAQHYHQDTLAESILQINQYFRYSMLDSGVSVPLAEETDNALNYLKLVNVMREDKIQFDLIMDDWSEAHASTAMIPKMLLQPLLENAVRHGVKTKKNAYISIQITYEAGYLQIRTSDNGSGMDEETLRRINALLSSEEETAQTPHVGLMNVIRRLKLIYPNAHTVSVESSPYLGTTVILKLWLEGKTAPP